MYGYYGYGLYDPTMILVLIGAVLSLWASAKVKNTFNRYSSVRSMTGMTGAEAAQRLLNSQGIYDVTVRPVSGQLTDHYDPRAHVLRLSDATYASTSVAAVGVAAHECFHTQNPTDSASCSTDCSDRSDCPIHAAPTRRRFLPSAESVPPPVLRSCRTCCGRKHICCMSTSPSQMQPDR